jgi:16S rRNA (guanine(966)-N(2))-methyltransferase RsmD
MRISSGLAKGRIVKAPKGVELRPTEERVRQALFNILAPALPESRFLDLFCGSGAVGLEALSRGAGFVAFADMESRCLASAEAHLKEFGLGPEKAAFHRGNWESVLSRLEGLAQPFDFIFLDPPYASQAGLDALRRLGSLAILRKSENARVILEHPKSSPAPERAESLDLYRQYPYGNSTLSFYGAHAD